MGPAHLWVRACWDEAILLECITQPTSQCVQQQHRLTPCRVDFVPLDLPSRKDNDSDPSAHSRPP
jgi:hypothetical protein